MVQFVYHTTHVASCDWNCFKRVAAPDASPSTRMFLREETSIPARSARGKKKSDLTLVVHILSICEAKRRLDLDLKIYFSLLSLLLFVYSNDPSNARSSI